MTGKHKETPWYVATCNSGEKCWCRLIVSEPAPTLPHNDYRLEDCIAPSGSIGEANAAFIVRAVNAHAGLVRALESIAKRATPHPDDTDADRKRDLLHCEYLARAALSAAKE